MEQKPIAVKAALPELLAPAGNIESFYAAAENGADAVYLGLKRFNARVSAANFSLEELSRLIPYARKRGIRIYVALNSVIAASEIPELLDILQALRDLAPDALIVQDAGIFYLVRKFFPEIKLHASTLMTAHNSSGVDALAHMGADRVVLARELDLNEIDAISRKTSCELEAFVHGALCFSYSGLCLSSSYHGGHSGLRGMCVQPCRLRFRQGKNEGFYLSCSDQCALPLIPKLKRMRLSALKIEGRMKPADYIGLVVKAYRMVLDAPEGDEENAIRVSKQLLAETASRRLTAGYFEGGGSAEILAPHRSGSSGLWIGTVTGVEGAKIAVQLRHGVEKGDRLRPESGEGVEKQAFTVSAVFNATGKPAVSTSAGAQVLIPFPGGCVAGDRLFRIGRKTEQGSAIWKRIKDEIPSGKRFKSRFADTERVWSAFQHGQSSRSGAKETLVLKIGSTNDFKEALDSPAQIILLAASRGNLEHLAKFRFSRENVKRVGLALPPILSEAKDLDYYRAAIGWFLKQRIMLWELNNWGQFGFFGGQPGLDLIAGAKLNLRNAAAIAQAAEMGCKRAVLSLEVTRQELEKLSSQPLAAAPIVTLHCWPPLFTSRLLPPLKGEKSFVTPRKEHYLLKKAGNVTYIYTDRPVNWFEHLAWLRSIGFAHFTIDSEVPETKSGKIGVLLRAFEQGRAPFERYSPFNFDRRP